MSEIKARPVEILVLGKIGVGKSSFINYIMGKEVCKVGSGEETTKEGIFKSSGEIDSVPYNIYDSWGLKADNDDNGETKAKWEAMIDYFFAKDDRVKPDFQIDRPDNRFCHNVFYCIRAGEKVSDKTIDLVIIKKILDEYKQQVTVVLTKFDQANKTDATAQKEALYKLFGNNDKFHIIVSQSIEYTDEDDDGNKIVRKLKGKNQAITEIYLNFFQTMVDWIPGEVLLPFESSLQNSINNKLQEKYKFNIHIETIEHALVKVFNRYESEIKKGTYNEGWTNDVTEKFASDLKKDLEEILNEDKIKPKFEELLNFSETEKVINTLNDIIKNRLDGVVKQWITDLVSISMLFKSEKLELSNIFGGLNLELDKNLPSQSGVDKLQSLYSEIAGSIDVAKVAGTTIKTIATGVTVFGVTRLATFAIPVIGWAVGLASLGAFVFDLFSKYNSDKSEKFKIILEDFEDRTVKNYKEVVIASENAIAELETRIENYKSIPEQAKNVLKQNLEKQIQDKLLTKKDELRKKALADDNVKI